MGNSRTAQLDDTFYALSDPTRRAIVLRLCQGEATVGELSQPFTISAAAMSKHLRVLEQVGLVRQHKVGRNRHCRLLPGPLSEASDFFDRYQHFWQVQLDRLAEYAKQHQPPDKSPGQSQKLLVNRDVDEPSA